MKKVVHGLVLVLLGISLLLAQASTVVAAGSSPGVIAYTNGSQIRLINPDGSGDHAVYSVPDAQNNSISELAWSPDGSRIAFISDQEAITSYYKEDVYSILANGSGFKKITNAPSVTQMASLPKGTVTLDVEVDSPMSGPIFVYVAGAPLPQTLSGAVGVSHFTFTNVADFGAHAQPVVAFYGQDRWFNAGIAPDVLPGQTVYAGKLVLGSSLDLSVNHLSWISNSAKVGFVLGNCSQLMGISSNPAPGTFPTPVVQPNVLGFTCLMDYAPGAAQAGQLLYYEYSVLGSNLYRATEGQPGNGTLVYSFPSNGVVLDLHWLPDGSGFVYSQEDDLGGSSNLYLVKFGDSTPTPLTNFTSEFTGHFSISPDGSAVAFERAATLDASTSIWVLDLNTSQMSQLVADGARPSWGMAKAAFHGAYSVLIPLINR